MQNNDAPGIAKTDILRHNQKHRHDDPGHPDAKEDPGSLIEAKPVTHGAALSRHRTDADGVNDTTCGEVNQMIFTIPIPY
jgi:hypothetical protein